MHKKVEAHDALRVFILSIYILILSLYSLSGDDNLVPFHLWSRETMQKYDKVSRYLLQNCKDASYIFRGILFARTLSLSLILQGLTMVGVTIEKLKVKYYRLLEIAF